MQLSPTRLTHQMGRNKDPVKRKLAKLAKKSVFKSMRSIRSERLQVTFSFPKMSQSPLIATRTEQRIAIKVSRS